MHQLEFNRTHLYAAQPGGISLPVVLSSGPKHTQLLAYLDTGASHCLFARTYGEVLGLDIESGDRKVFSTAAGPVAAFGHTVAIETLGIAFESEVYFFADEYVSKNLLGRTGWLDRIKFGLVDHDQTLYLAQYDFTS